MDEATHTYELDAEERSTIRRALKSEIEDVQADPDYAEDERAERLDRLRGAIEALERPVLIDLREMAAECEYDEDGESSVDALIDYKNALEDALTARGLAAPEIRPQGNEGRPE